MKIDKSKNFKNDVVLCKQRGYKMDNLKTVISKLADGELLDQKYQDHKLKGIWAKYRECHIEPDWLLIYRITNNVLYLTDTGTHSDLY